MTRQATVLQQNQIDDFWARGFLTVEDLFSPAEVTALHEATESEAIRGPQNERILSLIRPLIGNDIQLQHSKIASKPPAKDSGPYRCHQDFAFFPHSNTSLVAHMVMLDDSTTENGCMQVVVGSHKLGLLDHHKNGVFSECQQSSLWADPAALAHITPRAGGISIHHCLTLHGSPPNRSGQPRR